MSLSRHSLTSSIKCVICQESLQKSDIIMDNGRIYCHTCSKNQLGYFATINNKDSDQINDLTCQFSELMNTGMAMEDSKSSLLSKQVTKSTNLETFTLVWLDANAHMTKDNIDSQKKLREAINFLLTFDKANECEDYIKNIINEKIVLMVSGSLGRDVLPHLHHLSQLNCIYVYCFDKAANQKWSSQYPKIKGVFTVLNELIECMHKDQIAREKVEDSAAISVFNRSDKDCTHKNLKSENGSFMWFQLIIEVLICMQHSSTAKKELIDILKSQYQQNAQDLNIIEELESNYHASNAIWWYTRESCLYRVLNKALRVQNIDIIFGFGFLISDMYKILREMHQELKCATTDQSIRVYRGQMISRNELQRIRRSIGEFISINSFFSTSRNREKSLTFINKTKLNEDIRLILFDIHIDIGLSTKPFADVTKLSYYQEEEEIIFMLGSIFRITEVDYNETEQIWIAKLILCNEDDHDLKTLFAYYKGQIGKDLTNAVSLGDILFKMGEFDKAKHYYYRILAELETNDPSTAHCYFGLGNVAIEQAQYTTALEHHVKALEIKTKFTVSNKPSIASSYNQVGMTYRRLRKFEQAAEYLKVGLKMRLECLDQNDVDLAQSFRDIGFLYYQVKMNDLALKHFMKAHEIYTKTLPEIHPDIAENLGYIGYVHNAMKKDDLALKFYKKALEIDRKALPENHPDIGVICDAIGNLLFERNEYSSALHYYTQALAIYHKSLPPSHKFVKSSEAMAEKTKQMLSLESQKAAKSLVKNLLSYKK